jgi:hypothetical protein
MRSSINKRVNVAPPVPTFTKKLKQSTIDARFIANGFTIVTADMKKRLRAYVKNLKDFSVLDEEDASECSE